MLGHRSEHRGLLIVQTLPHQVDPDSFYGPIGAASPHLFWDDDLAERHSPDGGQSGLPPFLVCGVLPQLYDDVSDAVAAQRATLDLRPEVALGLALDSSGLSPSGPTILGNSLVENGEGRYACDRFLEPGRKAGFIPDTGRRQ